MPSGLAALEATTMNDYPNPKVTALVYHSDATAGFTPQDWRDLAMAALDQGGVALREYAAVEKLLASKNG
jgi:hypothetical protein